MRNRWLYAAICCLVITTAATSFLLVQARHELKEQRIANLEHHADPLSLRERVIYDALFGGINESKMVKQEWSGGDGILSSTIKVDGRTLSINATDISGHDVLEISENHHVLEGAQYDQALKDVEKFFGIIQ